MLDDAGEVFGGGVAPFELRHLVEVLVVVLRENAGQHFGGQADVDHQVVGVEFGALEGGVDDVGGPVEFSGRSESLAGEAVGDHEVVSDGQRVHVRAILG